MNRTILPKLLAMTQAHCAYCDGYPLDTTSKPTIDHFLPKARYPERSYDWRNLYPACPMCQSEKEVRFDNRVDPGEYRDELLRPDGDGYAFERYFVFNYKSGHIEANPRAEDADRERAAFTIDKFGLNQGSRPQTRLRTL